MSRAARIAVLVSAIGAGAAAPARAQAPLRKIGELDLRIVGVTAVCEPFSPVVPRNTASAVRIVVRSGASELSLGDVARFFGSAFGVEGELSGPGLATTVTLPQREPGDALPADPLLLPIPALPRAGDYSLSNLRLVSSGRPVLDVSPAQVVVKVIDQVLVTSVVTRPLTLDELRDRGVDLSSPDNYLGFAFTLGLKLESGVVNLTMPVVFDRQGRVVPEPIQPPPPPPRASTATLQVMPTIVPMLLEAEADEPGGPPPSLQLPQSDGAVRIPSVLVIPGNVGYLKQFFSAQLFVANGAPAGSGLVVRDVTGHILLPLGKDGIRGVDPTSGQNDDPLSLPNLVRDGQSVGQSEEMAVLGLGPDGAAGTADDDGVFGPGEQGLAEFTVRGDAEGFHTIDFDIRARLEGLPIGPVKLKGHASGGVLVRNPYFSVTFTAPSVVRPDERFKLYVTVTNVGQGAANLLTLSLDDAALSGLDLAPGESGTRSIDSLAPGAAASFALEFTSRRTGQVVASYLRFDAQGGAGVQGDLRFTVGVGERGVPLSPDTLVLPTSVDSLPGGVVQAAMRVLGQAWSVANAPNGTLPQGVTRTTRTVVTQKALALAEAGLRVRLGEQPAEAVRDLLYDFWSGDPAPDPGFDQLLRTTEAGQELARAIGASLGPAAAGAGGALDYERELSRILASGREFLTFAVAGGDIDVTLRGDEGEVATAAGRVVASGPSGAVLVPLEAAGTAPPWLGLLTAPAASSYVLELRPREAGAFDVAVTLPRGDGSVLRGTLRAVALSAGERARVVLDLVRPDRLLLERDLDGDGLTDDSRPFEIDSGAGLGEGPTLRAARVVGPETISSASPFGTSLALLFDRVVDGNAAAVVSHYVIPATAVQSARRQLSGRIVFATLDQPEGNHLPTRISVDGLSDLRGRVGPPASAEPVVSLVEDPGAVVTGRVLNGDGSPLGASVAVTYSNDASIACGYGSATTPVSQVAVDEQGGFEFRYVRRSPCGAPFELLTQDPVTGALRKVTRYVRADGERIVLDIALLARGSVTGTVRRFRSPGSTDTVPAAGVAVTALSVSDPQSGGSAVTDGDGRYRVDGVTVGPIVVRAGGSTGIGSGSGRIDRPGTPAVVDILLDENAASIHGTVFKVDPNVPDPAQRTSRLPGVQVQYQLNGQLLAVATTDESGSYRIDGVPVGDFVVSAALNQRDRGATAGRASVGQDVPADVFVEVPLEATLGTVRGTVFDASGAPAGDVYVTIGDLTVLTSAGATAPVGEYEVPGVPVTGSKTVTARTRDGKRSAMSAFTFPAEPSPSVEVDLHLSGLGEARLLVLDPAGRQLHGQAVLLQGVCLNPCGCRSASTGADDDQPALFSSLPLGTHVFRAFRQAAGYTDVAGTTVTLTGAEPTLGIIQFRGAGSVSGVVLDPPAVAGGSATPAGGADVLLSSRVFLNDGQQTCDLVPGVSHRVRTGADGSFAFSGVTLGSFAVTAHSDFLALDAGARGALTRDGEAAGPLSLQFIDTLAGVLSGHVYLPDGVTPAGAGIEVTVVGALPDVTVKTGADGAFRFAHILAEGTWTLTAVDHETGFTARTQVALRRGEDASHDVRLKGRGTVRVHVVDGALQAIDQARVVLDETEYPSRHFEGLLSPASGGIATFQAVSEGPFSVTASDALGRGGRTAGTLARPDDTVDLTLQVTTTGTVSGHFRLPGTGAAVPLGTVTLIANGRTVGQVTTDSSGDPGRFSFSYVPAGQIRVEAVDPLTGRTGFNVGTLQDENQELVLDVTAQALGIVTGVVRLNGSPEPRARIDLVSGSFRVSSFAGADGAYRVEGVPEGRVVVTAARSGGGLSGTNAATLVSEGEILAIDVALRDTGRVEGTVRAAGGGAAPLSLVTVEVGGVGGGKLSVTTNPEDGSYLFEQVPAGLATFSVEVPGSIDRARSTAEVLALDTVRVDLELNGIGAISGTVSGVPTGYSSEVRAVGTGPFPYQVVVKPSPSGTFLIPEVLAGPVTVSLRASGALGLSGGSASGTVLPRQTATFDLAIQPTGSVRGTVLRSDGRAGFGAEVRVSTSAGLLLTQAGLDGQFVLDTVPAGAVTVAVADKLTGGVGRGAGSVPEGGELLLDPIHLDDTPVAAMAVDPADGATGVALDQAIRVLFSDPVADASQSTLFVSDGARVVSRAPQLSADGLTLTLLPQSTWPDARELIVTATTGISDVFGRHPLATFTSRFRTVDVSPPAVTSREPADGAIQVPPTAVIGVGFDEPLAAAADVSGLVSLTRSGPSPVAGTISLSADRRRAVLTPVDPLLVNERYTVSVAGAVDESGNRQQQAISWTFVTTDTIPPTVAASAPATGSWTSAARPFIQLLLADAQPGSGVDTAAATAGLQLDGAPIPFGLSTTALTATPVADLGDGHHLITASVHDRAGNEAALSPLTFGVDRTPPTPAFVTSPVDRQTLRGAVTVAGAATDATSGVASIRILLDGGTSPALTLSAPDLVGSWSTSGLSDGWHQLKAVAVDVAGNVGAAGAGVDVLVDNQPLTVVILAPLAGARFRDRLTARVRTSEPVARLEFTAGTQTVAGVLVADRTYEVSFELAALPEGDLSVTVSAFGLLGETTSAAVGVVVDRTPPAAPDPARITAEESDAGYALVQGLPGAVERGATVELANAANGSTVSGVAALDGSFATRLLAQLDASIEIVAVDSVGNRSPATIVSVQRRTSEGGVPLRGLLLWASADQGVTTDTSGNVQSWADRSASHDDLAQATASSRPVLVPDGFNGLPVLRFDGTDDRLLFSTGLATVRTVFWMLKESETAGIVSRSLLGHNSWTFNGGTGTAANATTPEVPGALWSSNASTSVTGGQTRVNGQVVDGTHTPRPRTMSVVSLSTTAPVSADKFGESAGSGPWKGDLAELIVYDRPLTAGEVAAVEDYLVRKYRPYPPSAATPAISPAGGAFSGSTTVQLTTSTPGASIRYTLDGSEPTTSSDPYTGPLLISTPTTVKARAFLEGYLDSATATATFVDATASPVVSAPGLALWLRADAGIATDAGLWVSRWGDQSGRANDASQVNGSLTPRLVVDDASRLPAVHFDGADDAVSFTAGLSTIRTVFWVLRESETAGVGSRSLLGHNSWTFNGGTGTAANATTPEVPGALWSSNASTSVTGGQTRVNGLPVDGLKTPRPRTMAVVSLVTTGSVSADKFGPSAGSSPWAGDLAELIVYDRALSAAEVTQVEDYLYARYRLFVR